MPNTQILRCGVAVLSQVNRQLGAAMGLLPSVLFRHARTMREDDETLVPRDLAGRNTAVHLLSPILNIMLSAASADPITAAPSLIRAWRRAAYMPPISLGDEKNRRSILPGQSLGLDLETLIHRLATSSAEGCRTRRAFDQDFRVTLTVSEALVATVERPSLGQIDQYDAKRFEETVPERQNFTLRRRVRQVVPLRRIVHLDFSYFEVAAELWADSLAHGVVYEPSLLEAEMPFGSLR